MVHSHSRPEDAEHEGSDAEMSPRPVATGRWPTRDDIEKLTDRNLAEEVLLQLIILRREMSALMRAFSRETSR